MQWSYSFNGSDTEAAAPVGLWMTEAATAGDWIAVHYGDTTNPQSGLEGDSYRIADADEEVYDVVGVLVANCSAASFAPVQMRGRINANVDSAAAVVVGDKLSIGAAAGRAIEYTGTNPALRVIGVCVSTPSGNLADVIVFPHPRYLS